MISQGDSSCRAKSSIPLDIMLRRIIAGTGRTFITIGVLLLLFVAYQLWGTGLQYSLAQDKARSDFESLLAATGQDVPAADASGGFDDASLGVAPLPDAIATTDTVADTVARTSDASEPTTATNPTTQPKTTISPAVTAKPGVVVVPLTTTTPTTASTIPEVTTPTLPKAKPGRTKMKRPAKNKQLARMVIPRIKKDLIVVEGAAAEDLKTGPGHYTGMPFPGEEGNVGIACHRTTFGQPCFNLDLLQTNDPIFFQAAYGTFRYEVREQTIVGPKDKTVLAPAPPGSHWLTITTCHPKYTARQRLVIRAELVSEAVDTDLYFEPEQAVVTKPKPTPTAPPTTVDEMTFDTTVNNTVPDTTSLETTVPDSVVTNTVPNTGPDTGPDTGESVEDPTISDTVPSTDVTPSTDEPLNGSDAIEAANRNGSGPIWHFGWFTGARSFWFSTLLWIFVCAAIWFAAWMFAKNRRRVARIIIYTGGFLILFLPALYVCFQNLTHLLPENV
jgi:sortase A